MSDQRELRFIAEEEKTVPVECLGMTFDTDAARRKHFTELLRERLQDPEFRRLPGFPTASDEDILELSDPPYYTACPNPFLGEFIASAKRIGGDDYQRTPLTEDVSASKADVIYTAHTYHTKVPPQAIASYISHFTDPGDVVLDFFCGSGMTALACRMVDDQEARQRSPAGAPAAPRSAICIDLSPAATFISSVYALPPDEKVFTAAASRLLKQVDEEMAAAYRVGLVGLSASEVVEYILWTEALFCPNCQGEVVSAKVLRATSNIGAADAFPCPHCEAMVSKAPTKKSGAVRLERRLRSELDLHARSAREVMRRVPVSAQVRDIKQRSKSKARRTVEISEVGAKLHLDYTPTSLAWFPSSSLIQGERYLLKDCLASYGVERLHHFYLPRQLESYSRMWELAGAEVDYPTKKGLKFFVQSNALGFTVMNRYQPTQFGKKAGGSQVNRNFSGTLYVPSMVTEVTPNYAYGNKLKRLGSAFKQLAQLRDGRAAVSTQSATDLRNIPADSIDYIFVDPPFGKNLQYSELNQLWEAWLRVGTARDAEAVIDETRNRGVHEYSHLMKSAFSQGFRVLKPGRWITVEFHNSENTVWHAIQEALFGAGFVVADVRTLNKMQETYKQSRQGLMKQDLVISAYKPALDLGEIQSLAGVDASKVWGFARDHLRQLPIANAKDGVVEPIAERQGRVLFDRMVAYFVQRGIAVPMSAGEFYAGLDARFPCRDEVYFLEEQVVAYERARASSRVFRQMELFVADEATAIDWIRAQLKKKPQTFKELNPLFMRELQAWSKHEQTIELSVLLEQNFVRYDGQGPVPSQVHGHLSSNFKDLRNLGKDDAKLKAKAADRWYVPDPSKQTDIDQVRERALLKEFEEYTKTTERKLSVVRAEAVRAGFKAAWHARDYATIVRVAKKIPEDVLGDDDTLLMYYDNALTRLGDE